MNHPDDIPIIAPRPQVREVRQKVDNFILSDKDGSAIVQPAEDLTPIEGYRLALLMLCMVIQPRGIVPDPQTQGRSGMLVITEWRAFIAEHKLERHFKFVEQRLDQAVQGSG